jgi:thiamine biosynthesis lipoprotein
MKSCSNKVEFRRCRPLLGTFVEIKVQDNDAGTPRSSLQDSEKLNVAINRAFTEIERIQNLMSAHDSTSELSRLNREAFHQPVGISAELFQLIERGLDLSMQTNGAFDFTIGGTLARWGFLPSELNHEDSGATWRNVQILSKNHIQFSHPLTIDLGGIAKGYAVDRAVAVLEENGVNSGIVNAGGDLKVFGSQPFRILLRHPTQPTQLVNPIDLQNSALATSCPIFTCRKCGTKNVSHLINPAKLAPIVQSMSVSVRAAECWIADALTKVVLNMKNQASQILHSYQAEAFILSVDQ